MISFFNYFVKITGYIPYKLVFRTKILYEDKSVQSRKIKGKAIVISNHTSVYDYAQMLFVFFFRTLRYQMAEVLFQKKLLKLFLKAMGGIFVDRNSHDFSFIAKSERVLYKKGVVGIFPESRLPKEGEQRPLEFVPSVTYLALSSDTEIIPVYTNGEYFSKKRAIVVIGKPVKASELLDESLSESENIKNITDTLREKVIRLGKLADEKS